MAAPGFLEPDHLEGGCRRYCDAASQGYGRDQRRFHVPLGGGYLAGAIVAAAGCRMMLISIR